MNVEALTLERPRRRTQTPVEDEAAVPVAVHGALGSSFLLRTVCIAFPIVLAGYALFDRAFAYMTAVPGTPLFAGEVLLVAGGLLAVLATGHFRRALRHNLPLGVLLIFAAWGLARTVGLIPVYGLDSIRDAALWYYSLVAVLVAALVIARPDLPERWARAYVPFVIVLLLWSPIAILLSNGVGPSVPGTDVSIFDHKTDNIAVAAATAIAFFWLVPVTSLKGRTRLLLTAVATVVVLAVGTQNRGGLIAALVGILLTGLLLGRRRRTMAAVMLGTVGVGFVLAWGFDVQVSTGYTGRSVSVSQLLQNVASLAGGSQDNSQLGANVEFRTELWSGVLNLAQENNALVTGLGFGPNLAQELGLQGQGSELLRSPHNSHIDVLARMGFVGGVLWLALWGSWYFVVIRRLRRPTTSLTPVNAGVLKVCLVGVSAILVNCFFDPTLESPQAAVWLWTLVGLGVALASRPNGPRRVIATLRVPSERNTTTAEQMAM